MPKKFVFGNTPVAKIAEEIRNDEQKVTVAAVPSASEQTTAGHLLADDVQPLANGNKAVANAVPPVDNSSKAAANESKPSVNGDAADEKAVKAKSADVGVTVQLPRKYYRLLRDIKDETGVPLRDLALKAVIQYVEGYQFAE
jgi:hypothetical protein